MNMSVAELKRAVDELTAEERLDLAAYLNWQTLQSDPEWQAELGRLLDRSLAGLGRSAVELRETHERLSSEGR